jgi:hypothetical protein
LSIDDRALGALLEESQDLHSDAMRQTRAGLADVVDHGQQVRARGGFDPDETRAYHEERSRRLTAAGAAAGIGAGAAILTVMGAQAAFADTPADVASAQTAASIENLAIAVYNKAATLSFMKNIAAPAGPTVVAFVGKTVMQHTDHAAAFNAAAARLGGKQQAGVDDVVMKAVVNPTLPQLKTPKDVVDFAAQLELVAAETYAVETAAVSDMQLRATFASIMGVEAQHRAILLAVSALLAANAPQLIKIGGVADKLPAAAGSIAFPADGFFPLDAARPPTEGAVK